MNDFDRFLELKLRHMLDPVVATQAPPRRGRRARLPVLTVSPAAAEIGVDGIAAVELVPVTVPVVSSSQL